MKLGLWSIAVTLLLITACHENQSKRSTQSKEKEKKEHIEKKEKPVHQKPDINTPVVTFEANTEDEVTDNDFIVKVFPTNTTDVFEVEIRYGGNVAKDDVTMVPKEYYKKISLRKGSNDNECILGFIDTEGNFKEMKSITASSTKIGIKTLKAYYLSTK